MLVGAGAEPPQAKVGEQEDGHTDTPSAVSLLRERGAWRPLQPLPWGTCCPLRLGLWLPVLGAVEGAGGRRVSVQPRQRRDLVSS